jgi:hypothetical protein
MFKFISNILPKDKLLYFIIGTYLTLITFIISGNYLFSLSLTCIVALLKEELYDSSFKENKFDIHDFLITFIGGFILLFCLIFI